MIKTTLLWAILKIDEVIMNVVYIGNQGNGIQIAAFITAYIRAISFSFYSNLTQT